MAKPVKPWPAPLRRPRDDDAGTPRSIRRYRLLMLPAVLLLALPVGVALLVDRPDPPPPFSPSFDGPDRLITNERAFHDPGMPGAVRSPDWLVTSGSLFARDGLGWTGPPDRVRPDPGSTSGTGSAVFRAVSTRDDFLDVTVGVRLRIEALTAAGREHVYDGAHLFLRYQSPDELYGITVFRQDDVIAIKRKLPSGEYVTLAQATRRQPMNIWLEVEAVVNTLEDGAVRITLYLNKEQVLSATDRGERGEPIIGPGRVGLRGDNCQFSFADFRVEATAE